MHRLKLLIVVGFLVFGAMGWILGTATERAKWIAMKPATQPSQHIRPGSEGWLRNQLNLTADQDAKIKDIWAPLASARSKYMDQWQQINVARDDAVRNLLTADQKIAVDSIYTEAEAEQMALEGRRDKEYNDAVAKTNELLTPDQQKKYKNILAHQHGGDHGHFARNAGPSTRPAPHDHIHEPH